MEGIKKEKVSSRARCLAYDKLLFNVLPASKPISPALVTLIKLRFASCAASHATADFEQGSKKGNTAEAHSRSRWDCLCFQSKHRYLYYTTIYVSKIILNIPSPLVIVLSERSQLANSSDTSAMTIFIDDAL